MRPLTPPPAGAGSSGAPVQQSFDFSQPQRQPVRSPGPSRLVFRLKRLWKKPWVRRLALAGVPLALVAGLAVRLGTDPTVHAYVAEQRAAVMQRLSARPEFAITGARVQGASAKLAAQVLAVVALPRGASTLSFDVAAAQAAVNRLPAVREARVTLAPDGVLDVHVRERLPVALWRDAGDRLWLVDIEGVAIDGAGRRADHPGLPLVLGEIADRGVAEAMDLIGAAPDLKPRIRALIRVGGRRWNVALDRDLTIMLPETDASAALARVMAWQLVEKVLDRGLSHIDMRVPERPALRMTPGALDLRPLNETLRDPSGEET